MGAYSVRIIFIGLIASLVVVSVGCGRGTGSTTMTGTQGGQLTVSPSSIDFGTVNVGSTASQKVTLSNAGGGNVTVTQVSSNNPLFAVSGIALPLSLSPSQTATLTVSVAPQSAGSVSGSLMVSSSEATSPISVGLKVAVVVSATGVISVTPSALDFGNVTVGNTAARTITITNTGGSSVTISQITVNGTDYKLTGITAPATLAAGASASPTVDFSPPVLGGATGGLQVISNASNPTASASLAGTGVSPNTGPVCGQQDDGLIHLPVNYTCALSLCTILPFPPPAKGASYADPAFGCTVTRLTDAKGDNLGAAAHHQYGTINAINANDSFVMVLLENGSQEIIDTAGNVVVPEANMPTTNTGNVPWDITVPTRFFYSSGASILRGDIIGLPACASTHNCTVTSTPLHNFAGTFSSVLIPDQEDISDDGDHLWLVGGTSAFLYTISTNAVGASMNVGAKESGWHKIQIMPSNRMLMTWSNNGSAQGSGQEVYNTDGTLNWHMFNNTIHTDCGRDLQGNEVCVASRIPDTGGGISGAGACPTWTGTQDGGIDVINMTTHGAQCLVDANWADTEVSFRDGNANAGWVFVTFFKSGSCPTYSCFDTLLSHFDLAWSTDWIHFAEEGILVRIDNNNSKTNQFRLFHTRSRSTEYYWGIPRGSISRDGKYVVFDSNFDIASTGLPNYTDVYGVKTQ